MSNISKRRREGSRPKIKSMGDHNEFLKRITKTLYYGELPELPCLSLPVTEVSCALWSAAQQGRSLRRLHCDAAARMTRGACVSPCALVLALLYLERLRHRNPDYLAATAPADLFLVSLMIGNKFLQDDGEADEVLCAEWAASGGLPLAHLKKLEIEFLDAIEWNVYVNNESFESGLAGLERRVALRQALGRGFFTYADLCAAGSGAAGLCAAAAALAVALTAVAALLASALLVPHAQLVPHTQVVPHTQLVPHTQVVPHTQLVPHTQVVPHTQLVPHTQVVPHTQLVPHTQVVPHTQLVPHAQPALAPRALPNASLESAAPAACCPGLLRRDEAAESIPKSYDATWTLEPVTGSMLSWLYRSSLDPMRRWLERLDDYADVFAETPTRKCGACAWLDLSRLGGLVVSDR